MSSLESTAGLTGHCRSGRYTLNTRLSPSPSKDDESDHGSALDDREDESDTDDDPLPKSPPAYISKNNRIEYLQWQLRNACRQAYKQERKTFEDKPISHVALGEDWQYSFDVFLDDGAAVNKAPYLDPQHMQDICLQIYHGCILTTTGQKFKDLLRNQNLDDEVHSRNLDQMCRSGYTKPNRVRGRINITQYEQLCKLFRELIVEHVKRLVRKCFLYPIQFTSITRGRYGVVQNPDESLSDTSTYSEQWKWLLTCAIQHGRPVPAETAVIVRRQTRLEIAGIAATVKHFVAKHALMEGSKVDELWIDIAKAVLDITPRELIMDKIKSMLREDAEELFDYDLVRDLYTPRERFCTWVPTLDEKKAHKTQYNIEHKKSDSVDATFERQLNVKVLETEAMLGNRLAQVGQTLLAALKKGIDRHPLLAFNGPDDIAHTVTPRIYIQAEKYGPGREDYDPPR